MIKVNRMKGGNLLFIIVILLSIGCKLSLVKTVYSNGNQGLILFKNHKYFSFNDSLGLESDSSLYSYGTWSHHDTNTILLNSIHEKSKIHLEVFDTTMEFFTGLLHVQIPYFFRNDLEIIINDDAYLISKEDFVIIQNPPDTVFSLILYDSRLNYKSENLVKYPCTANSIVVKCNFGRSIFSFAGKGEYYQFIENKEFIIESNKTLKSVDGLFERMQLIENRVRKKRLLKNMIDRIEYIPEIYQWLFSSGEDHKNEVY